MNLLELYKSCCKETKKPSDKVLNNLSEGEAKEYIMGYFDERGKRKAFDFEFFNDNSRILNKAIHTYSTFMLGFALKDIVCSDLGRYVSKKNPTWDDWNFEYTWFLTSLYHDCLSGYENMVFKSEKYHSLEYFLSHKESTYEYSIHDKGLNKKIFGENNLPVFSPTFSKQLIDKYFEYRLKEMKSLDHGILGGYLQFDRLIKNFKKMYDNAIGSNSIENGVFYTNNEEHSLVWRIQHLWHFAFVADAIIAHNIWYIDSNEVKHVELYKKYGLESLIVNKEEQGKNNRISLEKNPLLFFLAIVDTIEPTKYFCSLNPKFVLENISISYIILNNTIEINANNMIFNVELWYKKKFIDLKTWIDVKDIQLINNKIKIILKRNLNEI